MDTCFVDNVLYLADSYKISHHVQYPKGTTNVYSYFESRGGKYSQVCFFGLQYILKRWLVGPVVTLKMIAEASDFYRDHFGDGSIFNENGWKHIVEKHNGYLPLRIKAIREGTVVPVKNVLFTVENTDPEVPWLTNWFETILVQVWYPMTVCTNSRAQKEMIAKYMLETTGNLNGLEFKLHDFGYRGSSSVESAGIGDAAHLVSFKGTDTIAGIRLCQKYYNCQMAGFSIPAAEHSTITAWGENGEVDAFRNMLKQFPTNSVAVVSDSYDIFNTISNIWGDELKTLVENRKNGCLIIRPDSGDPKEIVIKVLELLAEKFPIKINDKGYKELPSYLRIIQGDGISYPVIDMILNEMETTLWSAENIAFGCGGTLLQKLDRDTLKCAFKCSFVRIGEQQRNVFKNPMTDSGKVSKKGRLTLEMDKFGDFVTIEEGKGNEDMDLLELVFENGRLIRDLTLDEIRETAEIDAVKLMHKK